MNPSLLTDLNRPSESWPDLVPLESSNLPTMNPLLLPSWAGAFAKALSEHTETPPELATGTVLITCATAAARRLRVLVKQGYSEPCNLWVVVALPPGNRKSAVQSGATSPLVSWEKDQFKALEPEITRLTSIRKTLEARAKECRNQAAKIKDPMKAGEKVQEATNLEANFPIIPKVPQIWTSDATPERLGVLLAENKECMAWLSSEGGVFEMLQGRYSKGIPNLDLVLKAHSGDSERVDRGSRPPIHLQHPCLSIGLCPQPEVLRGLATKPGFRGRGLLGRFLYLLPTSNLGFRALRTNPIPQNVSQAFASGIWSMLNWEPKLNDQKEQVPYLLKLSPDAYDAWFNFAQDIEQALRPGGIFEHFPDWAGKAPGATARIAGVLHGITHAHERPWEEDIQLETMNAAVGLMNLFTKHSLAALDTMGADPTIAAACRVWQWIDTQQRPEFTIRDAFNALRARFPRVKNLRIALDALEERGYLEIIEPVQEGPGRPKSPVIRIRPELIQAWTH